MSRAFIRVAVITLSTLLFACPPFTPSPTPMPPPPTLPSSVPIHLKAQTRTAGVLEGDSDQWVGTVGLGNPIEKFTVYATTPTVPDLIIAYEIVGHYRINFPLPNPPGVVFPIDGAFAVDSSYDLRKVVDPNPLLMPNFDLPLGARFQIEGIRIWLVGANASLYDVIYDGHFSIEGDLLGRKNGQFLMGTGTNHPIERIRVKVVHH